MSSEDVSTARVKRPGAAGRAKAFDELPALRVGGKTLRWSLRRVTIAWMFGVVWMSLISGSQMTTFARLIGFKDYHFGLFGAIPFCATFAQLIAAVLIERTGLRKQTFIRAASVSRLSWLAVAALPLVLGIGPGAVVAFFCIRAGGSLLGHFSMPAWNNWMGDLIPRRIRGRYLANRRLWTTPIQMAIVVIAGLILDRLTVPQAGGTPVSLATQPHLLVPICVMFAIAAVFGTIDILLFRRVREIVSPPLTAEPPQRPARVQRQRRPLPAVIHRWLDGVVGAASAAWAAVCEPVRIMLEAFRDRVFRHYALYGATVTFAITVGGGYFLVNALENVGYSKMGANVVFMVCGAASGMLLAKVWGKLIDRWGRRPVLILGTLGAAFGPIGWFLIPASGREDPAAACLAARSLSAAVHALAPAAGVAQAVEGAVKAVTTMPMPSATPLAYALGIAACMWGGGMWAGVVLAQSSVIFGFSESAGRSKHMAAAAVVLAIGGVLGGLAGGAIAEGFRFLQAGPIRVGPFAWINYHVNFLVSGLARLAAVGWLIGMPDPGSKRVRHIVRDLRFNAYNNVATRVFWTIRTWRQRQRRREESADGPVGPVARVLAWGRRRKERKARRDGGKSRAA